MSENNVVILWLIIGMMAGVIGGFIIALYLRGQNLIDKLEQRAKMLSTVVDTAVDAIITIDKSGSIVTVNPAAARMFAYRSDDMIGHNVKMLMPEPFHTDHDDYIANYLATGKRKIIGIGREVSCRRSDDSEFPADLAISEIPGNGLARFAGILRDRTEHEDFLNRLQKQQESLAHVNRLGTLGEMTAGLAHEINQPLTAIATYAQAAQRLLDGAGDNRNQLKTALVQVDEQAHRAGAVVRRMRALAKGEQTERKFCDLHQLIEDIKPLITLDARHRGVAVIYELAPENTDVFVDKVQIQQVMLNFVRNGIDAMDSVPAGKRRLIISTEVIHDHQLKTAVRDFGHGVSNESVDGLFHPFFTTKVDGMGMGLSISKSIISAHGGTIGFEHPSGLGARFWFILTTHKKERANE
ncbi:MAG: PAS domain S-box protein [Gammaproteobacteria bacterium]|nr:PAS domain S-box protein [Gammaproteobacteria bacterium]